MLSKYWKWRLLGLEISQQQRADVAQSRAKSPPSLHYIERSTWSEATKELILGTEPKCSQLSGAGSV